jgi:hypothetical protein
MTIAQRLAILGALAFLALLGQTLLAQGTDGASALLANPWGQITLADFYLGVLAFALVIFHFEPSPLRAGVWVLALACLGNPVAVLWLVLRGQRLFPPKA